MESANHEFTWLSGRAHLSIAREPQGGRRACSRENSFQSESGSGSVKSKISNISSLLNSHSIPKPDDKSSKPASGPRIFKRISASDHSKAPASPVYEIPPQDRSVFYVATPKDSQQNATQPEGIGLQTPTPTKPVDKSIIFEFDPILQRQEDDESTENSRLSAMRLSTIKLSTPISETPTLPLTKENIHERFAVRQELETPNNHSEIAQTHQLDSERFSVVSNSPDPSQIYNVPKKSHLTRTVSDASSNVSTSSAVLSSTPNSSPSSTSSRGTRRSIDEDHAVSDSCTTAATQPQAPTIKAVPVPKPRSFANIKSNKNVNKGWLSSVVPAPSDVYDREPTHQVPNVPSKTDWNVLTVENNLYMLCESGSAKTTVKTESTSLNNSGDENDSSSLDIVSFDPPPFPPPPPPPDYSEASANDKAVISNCLESKNCSNQKPSPKPRGLNAPPKPPRTRIVSNGPSVSDNSLSSRSNALPKAVNAKLEEKFKYPIYFNILGLCGEQGVYGVINRTNSKSENIMQGPPPLPPRGQQPQTPSFEILTRMAMRKGNLSDNSNVAVRAAENFRNSCHRGMLHRIGKGRKDITQKWVVLERGHLQCYVGDDKTDNPQEVFHRTDIVSVGKAADVKHSNLDLMCFEVVTIAHRDRPQVFGARYLSEREVWMKHLVQSLAPKSDVLINGSCVTKAGYVFLRKSVTGSFQICWLVLHNRQLDVSYDEEVSESFSIDLRKVISMQEFEQDPQMSAVTDEGPVFVIHYPCLTIYIRSTVAFDTLNWYQRILQITKEMGNGLEEQQLTHDDVPVIVEKCIKFVGTYGLTSKGIYRESAINSKITKLLDSFYKDAQKTDLRIEDHTVHEAANVLKRFLRSLPDPLLTKNMYPKWMAAVENSSVENYMLLLEQLPKINYNTLKKLMAHLRSVVENSEHNMMHALNLAQVFGPTLLNNEKDFDLSSSTFEINVTVHLIDNYFTLFGVSDEEIKKEGMIQEALKVIRDAKTRMRPAGDILVGIYIYDRQKCFNIQLSPTKTAYELCKHACQQLRLRERPENLAVFEVVCDGDLERPLHHSEIVLSVTLRWAAWSESDAKDNYLIIKSNDILQRVMPLTRQPLSTFGELKFATVKSKSFKKLLFEFKNARLAYYKDAKIAQPLESWNIEDITWYIGAESKRPAPWCITFIEHKAVVKRGSKEAPYFGRTVCFASEEEFNKWVASMLIGQYPNGILPKPERYDLLT